VQRLVKCCTAEIPLLCYVGGPAKVRFLYHLTERDSGRSGQVAPPGSSFVTELCKEFAKFAQSSGPENIRLRERILSQLPTQWCSACAANPFENTEKSSHSQNGRTLSLGQVAEGMGLTSNVLCPLSFCYYVISRWFGRSPDTITTGSETGQLLARQLLQNQRGPVSQRGCGLKRSPQIARHALGPSRKLGRTVPIAATAMHAIPEDKENRSEPLAEIRPFRPPTLSPR
jgi:hypothetical protein